MKDKLTIEQSQRLIELGVDTSKASGEKVFVDIHPEVLKGNAEYSKPWGFIPTFSLTDILSLLPKEIEVYYDGEAIPFHLAIITNGNDWEVSYCNIETLRTATELIDALYELLCWVIENGYLN